MCGYNNRYNKLQVFRRKYNVQLLENKKDESIPEQNFLKYEEDFNSCILGHVSNVIPTSVCQKIEKAAENISDGSYYGGHWSDNMPMNYACSDSYGNYGSQIDTIGNELKDYARSMIKQLNPKLFSRLDGFVGFKYFFPTICVNVMSEDDHRILKLHRDNKDFGISVLFYFNFYSGGGLTVHVDSKSTTINCKRGDCVLLAGSKFEHVVGEVTGKRISVVFFAHKSSLEKVVIDATSGQKEAKQQYNKVIVPIRAEEVKNNEYEVKQIMSHKRNHDGTLKYFVQWMHWGLKDSSWVHESELNAKELLEKYWIQIKKSK